MKLLSQGVVYSNLFGHTGSRYRRGSTIYIYISFCSYVWCHHYVFHHLLAVMSGGGPPNLEKITEVEISNKGHHY